LQALVSHADSAAAARRAEFANIARGCTRLPIASAIAEEVRRRELQPSGAGGRAAAGESRLRRIAFRRDG
jgi:hypothetical protein